MGLTSLMISFSRHIIEYNAKILPYYIPIFVLETLANLRSLVIYIGGDFVYFPSSVYMFSHLIHSIDKKFIPHLVEIKGVKSCGDCLVHGEITMESPRETLSGHLSRV